MYRMLHYRSHTLISVKEWMKIRKSRFNWIRIWDAWKPLDNFKDAYICCLTFSSINTLFCRRLDARTGMAVITFRRRGVKHAQPATKIYGTWIARQTYANSCHVLACFWFNRSLSKPRKLLQAETLNSRLCSHPVSNTDLFVTFFFRDQGYADNVQIIQVLTRNESPTFVFRISSPKLGNEASVRRHTFRGIVFCLYSHRAVQQRLSKLAMPSLLFR